MRIFLALALCWHSVLFSACSAAPAPEQAPDKSLPSASYVELGLPAADREWLGPDYVKAGSVLAGLAKTNHLALPRWRSNSSGQVFARITSPANYVILSERKLLADQRMVMLGGYLLGSSQILQAYTAGITKEGGGFDSEVVELMGFMLIGFTNAFAIAEEFMATLPIDDPKAEVRRAGFEKMKSGFTTSINGIFLALNDPKLGRRDVLAWYFEKTLPVLKGYLSPLTAAELRGRASEMATATSDSTLKASLDRIATSLSPPTKPKAQ